MIVFALLAASFQTRSEAQTLLDNLRLALAGGTRAKVEQFFVRPEDARGLWEMAEDRGGLRNLRLAVIPAPPGWTEAGPYWAIFHARQDIESYTDKVFALALTADGAKLGKERKVWIAKSARIAHQKLDVRLTPEANRADIKATTRISRLAGEASILFGLGDPYTVTLAKAGDSPLPIVQVTDKVVPAPKAGELVRAGSLMVVWGPPPGTETYAFEYSGVVNSPNEDKITPSVAYLTSWWAPTIAQWPFTTETTIQAPADWVVRSEGVPIGPTSYRCDVPISFPKVIGGKYRLAAERTDRGKTFRAWHLGTVDKARGERDVQIMADACKFFEDRLGPFPFPGYECFDADTYYGIESYSYTLLNYRYTTRFVSHEMGHTYFGGLVPCAYIDDTFNESLTQYVDSVLRSNNADRTLETGLRSINVPVSLSQMNIAHANNNATYMRGAYVMRMLENEIGLEAVLAGLKAMVADRVGKPTVWADLRAYFEKASGKNLDWFWSQWIDGATFPTLEVGAVEVIPRGDRSTAVVTVRQKGTDGYRLRFKVRVTGPTGQVAEKVVVLGSAYQEFQIDAEFRPVEVSIDVFGYCLAAVGPAKKL